MIKYKTVLALSGGLDSAVLLGELLKTQNPDDVLCVTFDYDARHNAKQISCARQLVSHYKINSWRLLDVIEAIPHSDSALISRDVPIPEGAYDDESMKNTVVPCRNLVFGSILAAYADANGATQIAIGVHGGDRVIYPDCRVEFITSLSQTVQLATEKRVKVYAPFIDWDKAQVVAHGVYLGVPLHMTWSCYAGLSVPCMRCGACDARRKAFAQCKVKDSVI